MQALAEEYEATNEELKSSNEELQSTNEELKSSNEELESDVEKVLSDLNTVEREIRAKDDRWFQFRIVPYRTADNVIDGVVATFNEITEVKHSEERAQHAKALAESTVNAIDTPPGKALTERKFAGLRVSQPTAEKLPMYRRSARRILSILSMGSASIRMSSSRKTNSSRR